VYEGQGWKMELDAFALADEEAMLLESWRTCDQVGCAYLDGLEGCALYLAGRVRLPRDFS
jgi:hypothetical protein